MEVAAGHGSRAEPGRAGERGFPDRAHHVALPHRREAGPRRHGCGLQGRVRPAPAICRSQVPVRRIRPAPGGLESLPARGPRRIRLKSPEDRSNLPNEISEDNTGGAFGMVTQNIFNKVRDKASQLADYPMPRVLAIASSHAHISRHFAQTGMAREARFSLAMEQADRTVAAQQMESPVLRIAVWHHSVVGPWSMPDPRTAISIVLVHSE